MPAPSDRPAPSSGSSGPPGDGWDDGRGGRRSRGGRGGGDDGGGKGGSRNPWSGGNSKLPGWVVPLGIGGVVLLIVVVVVLVVGRGDDAPSDSGSCLTDLVADQPAADTGHLGLTDVVAARASGYDDEGELEASGDSLEASGAIPDGLTAEIRFKRLDSVEEFTGSTGVEPGDIDCSVRTDGASVLGGTFDPAEVEGTDLAGNNRLAATEDRLALVGADGDAAATVKPGDDTLADNDDVSDVLAALREGEAYSAILDWDTEADGGAARAAGVGVAGANDDDRRLVVAWVFEDDDAATSGRRLVVETVNKVARGSASITVDDLEVDGSLVTASVPVRKAPNLADQWDQGTVLL